MGGLFLALSGGLFVGFLFAFLSTPRHLDEGAVELKVEKGEPFSSVVHRLKQQGVISHERVFKLWARLWSLDKKIHWGLYRFELPMAPLQVLDRMVMGKGVYRRITVAEGLTLDDIASLVEREGLGSRAKFLELARDPALLSQFGLEKLGVEGYLFPDTYYLSPSAGEREVLVAMLKQFQERFTPFMEAQAKSVGGKND